MRHSKPAAVVVVASFVLWACSPAPSASSRDDDQRSGSTSRETSENEKSATTPDTNKETNTQPGPAGPSPSGGACTAAQGEDACFACCEAKHPEAEDVVDQLVDAWMACACSASACAKQCAATACSEEGAEPADGDACDECLQGTTCDAQFDSSCEADASCSALLACESSCFPADEDEEEAEEDDEADRARAGAKAQRIASTYSHVLQLRRARR